MTEKKSSTASKKSSIISLLINPLLNYIDWEEEPKIIHYYSLSELVAGRKEKLIAWQKQKSGDLISFTEKLNDLEIASNDKLKQILEIRGKKIIFINFPRKKEDLQESDYTQKSLEIVEYAKKNKYKMLQRELSLRIDFEPEILQKSLQEKINLVK